LPGGYLERFVVVWYRRPQERMRPAMPSLLSARAPALRSSPYLNQQTSTLAAIRDTRANRSAEA